MKVCVTYANRRMRKTQQVNGRKIIASGFFDKVILTSPHDLSKEFVRDYRHILKYRRLGGYGIWKPYIIKQTLMTLSSEDILCYVDADFYFTKPIDWVIEKMSDWNQDIMPFCYFYGPRESESTKRDAFILMDCDEPKWTDSRQRVSGISFWKGGSTFALAFLDEWLTYIADARISTDVPSQHPEKPDFKRHLHDQSIFSLLTKKYDLKALHFPREGWDDIDPKYTFLALSDPSRLRAVRWKRFIVDKIIRPFPLFRHIHHRGFGSRLR